MSFYGLIEWCFTPLSTVFQSYHGKSLHYSCLSWVSPVLGWALKCLAQGHSQEKTQRIQCSSNPEPLDYESNTLPLSHAGPSLYGGRVNNGNFMKLVDLKSVLMKNYINPRFFCKVMLLVVLGFKATLTAWVISWRSVTHMCFLALLYQH